MTVTVRDANGNPVPNQTVVLSAPAPLNVTGVQTTASQGEWWDGSNLQVSEYTNNVYICNAAGKPCLFTDPDGVAQFQVGACIYNNGEICATGSPTLAATVYPGGVGSPTYGPAWDPWTTNPVYVTTTGLALASEKLTIAKPTLVMALTASPTTVQADGSSTSTVTVSLTDQAGTGWPVPWQQYGVTVSFTAPASLLPEGTTCTTSGGSCRVTTLTAVTPTSGTITAAASDQGFNVSQQVTLTYEDPTFLDGGSSVTTPIDYYNELYNEYGGSLGNEVVADGTAQNVTFGLQDDSRVPLVGVSVVQGDPPVLAGSPGSLVADNNTTIALTASPSITSVFSGPSGTYGGFTGTVTPQFSETNSTIYASFLVTFADNTTVPVLLPITVDSAASTSGPAFFGPISQFNSWGFWLADLPGTPTTVTAAQTDPNAQTVLANGSDSYTVTVTVYDVNGVVVPNAPVTLTGDPGDTFTPAEGYGSGTTDQNGLFVALLTSFTVTGSDPVAATVAGGQPVGLSGTVVFSQDDVSQSTYSAVAASAVAPWTSSAMYSPGAFVNVTDAAGDVWTLVCTTGGESSGTAPTWPLAAAWNSVGMPFAEGGDSAVVWALVGQGAPQPDMPALPAIAAWASNQAYAPGTYVKITDASSHPWTLICATAGTSSSEAPQWPTSWTPGATFQDGAAGTPVWEYAAVTTTGAVPADGDAAYLLVVNVLDDAGIRLPDQSVIGTDNNAADVLVGTAVNISWYGGTNGQQNWVDNCCPSPDPGTNQFVDMGNGVYVAAFSTLTAGVNSALSVSIAGTPVPSGATVPLTFFGVSATVECGSFDSNDDPVSAGVNQVTYGPGGPGPTAPDGMGIGGISAANGPESCGGYQFGTVGLRVTVTDGSGQPVNGATVLFTGLSGDEQTADGSWSQLTPGPSGTTLTGTTDSNGNFGFVESNPNQGSAPFATEQVSVYVNGSAAPVFVNGQSYILVLFGNSVN